MTNGTGREAGSHNHGPIIEARNRIAESLARGTCQPGLAAIDHKGDNECANKKEEMTGESHLL
jgi:hypothetical protein